MDTPVAPAAPQTQPVQAQQTHHSHAQPRDVGRFAGPPQAGQPAVPGQQPGETAAQAAARIRIAYKADGKDYEEELTQAEIAQRLGRDRASYERFEKASQAQKDAAAREQALRQSLSNPTQFRQVLYQEALRGGYSKAEAAEYAHDFMARALAGHLDEAEMDPRDRELMEYRQREEERQRQEQEQEKTAKAEAFKAGVRVKYEAWKNDIIEAAKAAGESGLPVDEETIRAMGKYRLQSMRHGLECSTAELVEVASKHVDGYVGARLKNAPYATLAARYPDLVKTIRLGLRDQARAARNPPPRTAPAGQQQRPPEPPKKPGYSASDFRSFQRLVNGE
jgi:transcriptional regulator with XRE-family HTH domain